MFIQITSIFSILYYRHYHCGSKDYGTFFSNLTKDDYVLATDDAVFIDYYSNATPIYDISGYENESIFIPEYLIKRHNLNYSFEYYGHVKIENYHHAKLNLRIRDENIYKINLGGREK